ncbi:MAG: hypothetical protein KDA51_16115, partial [Planctomycetales bacterium]|nr:hypothetical protein [Planctomycetales bacterium]
MIPLRRSFALPRFLPAASCMVASLCCGVTSPYCRLLVAEDAPPPFVVEEPPRSALEQQKMFHLPEGFHIELVASEPEVINPINLNFDATGDLYVSQSIEYPIPAMDQPGRDAIQRISSLLPGSEGRPRVETFADGLHIPIGLTAVPGGLLGFSVPQLYFFIDANGDGASEQREVRFGDFGFDDTHGMISSLTWWIDGWVYGCHGFVNTSEVAGSDGEVVKMVSGNTYRLRPDGSRIEHWAHGQVNPFGLTIDPWGNVFTSDCHTRPATHLLPGAHYPRSPGDGLGLGPELMQHSHGSTGIAGIVYYAAEQFPQAYRGSLFIGNPITGRINLDRLERHGSTYTAIEQADFLRCDDPWFRPVDIQLGPDGALYIADLYNCIIGHYEVPLKHPNRDRSHGRIWRVSYSEPDATGAVSPASKGIDLTSAEIGQLVDALGDPNLIVRTLATHQLVMRGPAQAEQAVRALLRAPTTAGSPSTPEQRAHALWVLKRWGAWANQDWQTALDDPSPLVRTHAVKALAEGEGWEEARTAAILAALDDEDGFVQRAAVEGLARHPQ